MGWELYLNKDLFKKKQLVEVIVVVGWHYMPDSILSMAVSFTRSL